jgi:tetratricopeptide (TPR) repeat protein
MEFLFETRPLPELTYAFKHALTQEVVYQSLLRQPRQQLHNRTAQVLVEYFAHSVEADPELVARHYTEAGLSEQAVAYWHQAGQQAIVLSAYTEAIEHLTTGLSVLTTLPDTPRRTVTELPLQLSLGFAHQVVSGFVAPATVQAFERAQALCHVVDDPPQYLTVLRGLTQLYLSQTKVDQAQALTEQYLRLAQRLHDPEHVQKAHTRLGWILLGRAELATAQTHLEQSLALYDPLNQIDHRLCHD